MAGLDILNVLIGIVTVYLTFGLACTAVVEAITAWRKVRSSNLEAAMNEFLAGDIRGTEKFVAAFYAHPLVQALSKGKDGRPSYIPPEIVGQVVQSLVVANAGGASLEAAVDALPGTIETNRIKGLLKTLIAQAKGDTAEFCKGLERLFNASMDRASGWFKRYAQNIALIVATLLVIGANVDTIALVTSLASNPAVRVKIVEIAEQRLSESKSVEEKAQPGKSADGIGLDEAKKQVETAQIALDRAESAMNSTGLQFGWKDYPKTLSGYLVKIVGLFVSILAISLGAPFWFDVLQRFMQIRATGSKDEKK
jgi:hypothetical protein